MNIKLGKILKTGVTSLMVLGVLAPINQVVNAESSTQESTTSQTESSVSTDSASLFKTPAFVYGGGLDEAQKKEVIADLKIKDIDYTTSQVLGTDVDKYLQLENTNTAGLFSSVYITRTDREGQNLVKILTPENITLVTEAGYATPLTTTGVSNLEVRVASPDSVGKVSGESALSGLYKALEEQGVVLDPNKVSVAQDELSTTSAIVENNGGKDMSYEEKAKLDTQLSSALTEIKTQLSEIKDKQVSEDQIEEIVNTALKTAGLENQLDKEDIQKLNTLAKTYVENKDSVLDKESIQRYKDYASNVAKDLQDKYGVQIEEAKGFISSSWEKIKSFFSDLFS